MSCFFAEPLSIALELDLTGGFVPFPDFRGLAFFPPNISLKVATFVFEVSFAPPSLDILNGLLPLFSSFSFTFGDSTGCLGDGLGLGEGLGEADGLLEGEGEGDGLGEGLGLTEGLLLGEELGDGEVRGLGLGEILGLGDLLGVELTRGLTLGEGDGLIRGLGEGF